MKRSAWWFGMAMLVGVSFAHGQVAQSHPPLAAAMEAQTEAGLAAGKDALAKDYNYHGALDLVGTDFFAFNNDAGPLCQYFERLESGSSTWSSG